MNAVPLPVLRSKPLPGLLVTLSSCPQASAALSLDLAALQRALDAYLKQHPDAVPGSPIVVGPSALADDMVDPTGLQLRACVYGAARAGFDLVLGGEVLFDEIPVEQLGDVLRALLVVLARDQKAGQPSGWQALTARLGRAQLRAEVDSVWAELGGDPQWDACRAAG